VICWEEEDRRDDKNYFLACVGMCEKERGLFGLWTIAMICRGVGGGGGRRLSPTTADRMW
jgi:hypothetical protein